MRDFFFLKQNEGFICQNLIMILFFYSKIYNVILISNRFGILDRPSAGRTQTLTVSSLLLPTPQHPNPTAIVRDGVFFPLFSALPLALPSLTIAHFFSHLQNQMEQETFGISSRSETCAGCNSRSRGFLRLTCRAGGSWEDGGMVLHSGRCRSDG